MSRTSTPSWNRRQTYVREQSIKELRTRLTDLFKPVNSWCYQDVLSLPAIDEIEPEWSVRRS